MRTNRALQRAREDRARLLATIYDHQAGKLKHLSSGDLAAIEKRIADLDAQLQEDSDA